MVEYADQHGVGQVIRWFRHRLTGDPLSRRERRFIDEYRSRGTRPDGSTKRSTMEESLRVLQLTSIENKYGYSPHDQPEPDMSKVER